MKMPSIGSSADMRRPRKESVSLKINQQKFSLKNQRVGRHIKSYLVCLLIFLQKSWIKNLFSFLLDANNVNNHLTLAFKTIVNRNK